MTGLNLNAHRQCPVVTVILQNQLVENIQVKSSLSANARK